MMDFKKNDLVFRRSTLADIDAMCVIADQAKAFLKGNGVSQWQRGTYPSREVFVQDVAEEIGYVVECEGRVAAFCAVTFTDEASYHTLQGEWLSKEAEIYATVHRSAVNAELRGRGVIGFLFEAVKQMAAAQKVHYVRIDTHMDNLPMQHALEKSGFLRCGILTLVDGDEAGDLRYGYEYQINE